MSENGRRLGRFFYINWFVPYLRSVYVHATLVLDHEDEAHATFYLQLL